MEVRRAGGAALVVGGLTVSVGLMVFSDLLPSVPSLVWILGLGGLALIAAVVGLLTERWLVAVGGFGLLFIGAVPITGTACLACACQLPEGYVHAQHIQAILELRGGWWPQLRIRATPEWCNCGCPYYSLDLVPLIGGTLHTLLV